MKIKYLLKYEPKDSVKLGELILKISFLIFLPFLGLIFLMDGLIMELRFLLYDVFSPIYFLTLVPIPLLGLVLKKYTKWRRGNLTLNDDVIEISGDKKVSILSKHILSFERDAMNHIRVDSKAYDLTVKLADDRSRETLLKWLKLYMP